MWGGGGGGSAGAVAVAASAILADLAEHVVVYRAVHQGADGRLGEVVKEDHTAGGNVAEGFFHGMGLALEGVRQVRGTSCNQVPGAHLSLVTGGPWAHPASAFLQSDTPEP